MSESTNLFRSFYCYSLSFLSYSVIYFGLFDKFNDSTLKSGNAAMTSTWKLQAPGLLKWSSIHLKSNAAFPASCIYSNLNSSLVTGWMNVILFLLLSIEVILPSRVRLLSLLIIESEVTELTNLSSSFLIPFYLYLSIVYTWSLTNSLTISFCLNVKNWSALIIWASKSTTIWANSPSAYFLS